MGWTTEASGEHEGWVSYVAPDGRTSGTSNGLGMLLSHPDRDQLVAAAWAANRTPTDEDMYELVPYADVVGWQVLCSGGWAGRRWAKDEADVRDSKFLDAENAYLPDGRSVEAHGVDLWSEHVAPVSRLSAVERAAAVLVEARQALDEAVHQARAQEPAASWAEIGRAAGITRQSAHEKWGSAQS